MDALHIAIVLLLIRINIGIVILLFRIFCLDEDDYNSINETNYRNDQEDLNNKTMQSIVFPSYPLRKIPYGLVLIITNIYFQSEHEESRESAIEDTQKLKTLFQKFKYEVIVKSNLTGKEIKDELKNFSQLKKLADIDSIFIIISSHGSENNVTRDTEIAGVDININPDYEKVMCSEIYQLFTAEACPLLMQKPKIFIIQVCRGKQVQKMINNSVTDIDIDNCVLTIDNSEHNVSKPDFTRTYSNMLIVQSTMPGFVSYRHPTKGSLFIYHMFEIFTEHVHDTHIIDLFNMVDLSLSQLKVTNRKTKNRNECQTTSLIAWGFNKHFFLCPYAKAKSL